jgi:hypothetical protein
MNKIANKVGHCEKSPWRAGFRGGACGICYCRDSLIFIDDNGGMEVHSSFVKCHFARPAGPL